MTVRTRKRRDDGQPRTLGFAGDGLPIEALDHDGLLVRSDGAYVRYLEVVPSNPLVLDEVGCAIKTAGFTDLLMRVPAGMTIQFCAQADPVALEALIALCRSETDPPTAGLLGAKDEQRRAQGRALRSLAAAHEHSLQLHADAQAAVTVRYVLVVPYLPDLPTVVPGQLPTIKVRAKAPKPILERSLSSHLRIARESAQLTDSLRTALKGMSMSARAMTGPEVADLLWARCAPRAARATPQLAPSGQAGRVLGSLDAVADREQAVARARRLRQAICQGTFDPRPPSHVVVDGDLEQTVYLRDRPERTFYGWLLHAMQSRRPWTLSLYVTPRDAIDERRRYERRERVLWGINRDSEDAGKRPDRAQQAQEAEIVALLDELDTGGETICEVAVYQSIREPGPDPDAVALGEEVDHALRALTAAVKAPVGRGEARQPKLWHSTLPLGLDVAGRAFRMITRNAADSVPFVSTSSGSPGGLPFAFAEPGRTVECINPFDRTHDNGNMVVFATSGGGKTMSVIDLASAALPRGAQVSVIDRSTGHWQFLVSLIPGAVQLDLGSDDPDAPVINPWDVEDPATAPGSKIAFLRRLHELLIGDHDAREDTFTLGRLERTLLTIAIREVYEDAGRTGNTPCESYLRAVLERLAVEEAQHPQGSGENVQVFRNLALALGDYCGDGLYAHLLDRPTRAGAEDAPLVVFNTLSVPDELLPAVNFCALELIDRRVERRNERKLRRMADGWTPAGPFDMTSVVVAEEVWKTVSRKATAGWLIEKAKRARHVGLWFILINQQHSELANERGQALLDNSTIQLHLRQKPEELANIAERLELGPEEVAQIGQLVTEKRAYAEAYLLNGSRGRGKLRISVGPHIYWLATSEIHVDLPRRELALTEADGDPWAALDLLADPAWHLAQDAAR